MIPTAAPVAATVRGMSDKTPGQVAYEGYLAHSGGRSLVTMAPLPSWEEQAGAIREAWEQAAGAVLAEYGDDAGDMSSGVRF